MLKYVTNSQKAKNVLEPKSYSALDNQVTLNWQ